MQMDKQKKRGRVSAKKKNTNMCKNPCALVFKRKKETPYEKKKERNTHFKCKQEGMHR
jgi:hypothetical protein